ncbi:unnamed protein product [Eruca vesicaria subsp. sativa]|uniref:Uncharacterized protein n=1 Tax=Eruca vesicaria subsp. sativa TaxID=29727 RepID=A0ABC8LGN5_ERUVS|nr:unnamed protein product [Eruca vesicaria subsp. sativa]
MEPSSLNDDVEFSLPQEFLTDDDFLLEKENKFFKGDECNLSPYELSHSFGSDSGFGTTGLTRKMAQSSLEDDFYNGFCSNHAFPTDKPWGVTRSSLCGAGDGYGHNRQTRVSSQAGAMDLYCAAVEKLATMNISDGYNTSRGNNDLPRKHTLSAAVKNPNDGAGYYSRQSLQYQKLQALRFQLMQQQNRGLKANNNKSAGHVNFSPPAWSNQRQRRDGSGMRAVFLDDRTGKQRKSTGTGVFLPRRANHTDETGETPTLATVLVPARVAEVLNLDESVVQQPMIRSSASLYEASWRQKSGFSSQMKMEQGVNEPSLPSDWAY